MPITASISHFLRWGAACLLTAVLVSGCAHRATVSTWTPAQIEVSGMQKLAVLGFSGEHRETVVSALNSRLRDNEFYTLVDRAELNSVQWVSATENSSGLLSLDDLSAAKSAGIDGLLVGDVIEYRCEERPVPKKGRTWRRAPKTDEPSDNDRDNASPESSEKSTGHKRQRLATVTVAFRLLDVGTGKIRASKQISRSATHEITDRPNGSPTSSEILETLARQCVDEFVTTLAPHQSTERVKLAVPAPFQAGCTLVLNGNEFAVRGRWEEAIIAWEHAIARNPENDAALFNLSIAHANRQDFTRAETFAIRAMNVRQKAAYEAGLQRIRDQASAFDQTLQQRRDLTSASFSKGEMRR